MSNTEYFCTLASEGMNRNTRVQVCHVPTIAAVSEFLVAIPRCTATGSVAHINATTVFVAVRRNSTRGVPRGGVGLALLPLQLQLYTQHVHIF
eukprot:3105485-Rhodomonas_salina.1